MSDMTDNEFIRYCESHSSTPRALFHVDHINRLYKLAGEDKYINGDGFIAMHDDVAHPLCIKARARMKS